LVMIAFFGVCWWAFSPKRKQRFEDDAKLPFADDDQNAKDTELEQDHPGDDSDRRN
jgi:cytochrome c oxidase cbb3-type subunit 4